MTSTAPDGGSRDILFLAYYFPPMGGPGVQRSSKFVKYLPKLGWRPTVISCDDEKFDRDASLLQDIPPDVPLHRIAWRPHKRSFLHRLLFSLRLGSLVTWDRLPDVHNNWFAEAEHVADSLLETQDFAAIYSTSAPYASHLVAMRLAARHNIPWVADFRDEWSDNPDSVLSQPRWAQLAHGRLEARVAANASTCVFAHPVVAERFRRRHDLPEDRVAVITNGYDPDDFPGVPRKASSSAGTQLVHTGTFYRDYNERTFIAGVKEFARRDSEIAQTLTIHFVGATLEKHDVPSVTMRSYPRLSHAESLRWLDKADALLLISPSARGSQHIPGKLFEYLAASRPILAAAPMPGTTADIVQRSGAGEVVDIDDPTAIADGLVRLCTGQTSFEPDEGYIRQFSRPCLTRNLAEIFETVTRRAA